MRRGVLVKAADTMVSLSEVLCGCAAHGSETDHDNFQEPSLHFVSRVNSAYGPMAKPVRVKIKMSVADRLAFDAVSLAQRCRSRAGVCSCGSRL